MIETTLVLIAQVMDIKPTPKPGISIEIKSTEPSIQLSQIFREENLGPIFASAQIFTFIIISAVIAIHFMFIRCIYFSVLYQKALAGAPLAQENTQSDAKESAPILE